jgi:hypothetical protein
MVTQMLWQNSNLINHPFALRNKINVTVANVFHPRLKFVAHFHRVCTMKYITITNAPIQGTINIICVGSKLIY